MTELEDEGFTIGYTEPAVDGSRAALAFVWWMVGLILLACSPALVIAAWRWAL